MIDDLIGDPIFFFGSVTTLLNFDEGAGFKDEARSASGVIPTTMENVLG